MVNFGPITAQDRWRVWGTPANFNGFASWQRYCTVLQQWASAKLCSVEQRAPPIFGRTAITLGIGISPHFLFKCVLRVRWQSNIPVPCLSEKTLFRKVVQKHYTCEVGKQSIVNTSAKNYRNRIVYVKITASQWWDVF